MSEQLLVMSGINKSFHAGGVELAYKSMNGESVDEIVDTGCKFYNSANMDQEDIAILLYD